MGKKLNTVPFEKATGSIRHNMTNDLCFHEVLISNNEALRGLIAALLHLNPEEIKVKLTNQVMPGENTEEKEYTLDISVELNDETSINLEMQVVNKHDWPERSLLYLCRDFDNVERGSEYKDVRNTFHIGFLDFTLFKDHPEFYGTYRLRNVKDGYEYSSKFGLSVVELNHIEMATEEDKKFGIDKWAEVFKAKTWEELQMITKDDKYLDSAARSVYMINQDKAMINRMLKREDEIAYEKAIARDLENAKKELAMKDNELTQKDIELAQKDNELAQKDAIIQELKKKLEEK